MLHDEAILPVVWIVPDSEEVDEERLGEATSHHEACLTKGKVGDVRILQHHVMLPAKFS